jgi:hypothetical protein
MAAGWKYFLLAAGIAALAFGLACFVFGAGAGKPPSAHAVMYALGALFAAAGTWCVAYAVRFRIVLTEQSVELRGLLKASTLRRDAIVGRRRVQDGNGAAIELVPRNPAAKPLQLPLVVRVDEVFQSWLQPIPDQDAVARQRALETAQANHAFGASPGERLAHVERFGRRVRWLGYASLAAMLWGLFYPRPYELVIGVLVVLPLIALVLAAASNGAVGIDGNVREHRALVAPMVIGPGLILFLRAWLDLDTLDWPQALGIAMVLAALLTFAIARIDRSVKPAGLWLFGLVFSLPYAYGGLVQTNFLLDASPAQCHEATVLAKRETTGKGASRKLVLGSWGRVARGMEVGVTRDLYAQAGVGDTVCVHLFEGKWLLAWYVVRACPEDPIS